MNKILPFLFVVVFVFAISATLVAAQEETAVQAEITTQDLGVEDPGVLPTSRFYFFKNITRGIKRAITFNSVKKAELELNISNEQAAEIARMKEVSPERTDAITKATSNYQQNVDRLKTRLDAIKETSQNSNVDKLMEKLADRSIKHQQLFDELKQKFEDKPELKQRFVEMQDKMNEATVKIPEKFDSPEMFKERMKKAIEARPDNPFREIRGMEMMEKIGEKLPEDKRAGFEGVKDDLMKKFEERVNAMPEDVQKAFVAPHMLEKIPGNPELRMKILEETKGRIMMSQAMKEQIESVQGQILERAVEKGDITKEKAEEQIRRADKSIQELESVIGKEDVQRTDAQVTRMKNLLAQAKKHLDNAENALEAGKYGEAFGQATSANIIARNNAGGNELFKPQPAPLLKPMPMPEARPAPESVLPPRSGTGTTNMPRKEILPSPPTGILPPSTGEQTACTQEYSPVCGVNGKTYSNACHAKVAGIAIKSPGACQSTSTPTYPR